MFNAAFCLTCKHELDNDVPDLLQIFDVLYYHCFEHASGPVRYQKPDGSCWYFVVQDEGFTQGCPLSPFLACKVLHLVLWTLSTKLMQCTAACVASGWLETHLANDGHGSEPVALWVHT